MTLSPSFFSAEEGYTTPLSFEASGGPWYFYFIYALSWIPLAFGYALLEKGQNEIQVYNLSFTC